MIYEVYLFKSGRKIPSPPEMFFVNAKDTNDLRKKLLKKYSVYHNGRDGIWGDFEVYHKNKDVLIGQLIFNRYSKYHGPYYWEKPRNFYNGNQDTWPVDPVNGKLISWKKEAKMKGLIP